MRFFDLHCDTIYEITKKNGDIFKNDLNVSLEKTKNFKSYIGCFAVWIPDSLRGQSAFDFFEKCQKTLHAQAKKNENIVKICKYADDAEKIKNEGGNGIILTVEGSAALGGDLSKVSYLKKCGVKMMTLTWNGVCEAGDGAKVDNPKGLTKFGKNLVKKLEENDIIIDISHASEKLFYDVAEICEKPIVATHSNCKKVCGNPRNLTDGQIKIIKEKGGLIGLTFCKDFLSNSKNASMDDVLRHFEHFLLLSCEDNLAFGSDFDGADTPEEISSIDKIKNLYEYFLKKGYKENLLDKVFFSNAYDFVNKVF